MLNFLPCDWNICWLSNHSILNQEISSCLNSDSHFYCQNFLRLGNKTAGFPICIWCGSFSSSVLTGTRGPLCSHFALLWHTPTLVCICASEQPPPSMHPTCFPFPMARAERLVRGKLHKSLRKKTHLWQCYAENFLLAHKNFRWLFVIACPHGIKYSIKESRWYSQKDEKYLSLFVPVHIF